MPGGLFRYRSQRLGSAADVLKYTWLKPDEVLKDAKASIRAGAKRVCLVARPWPERFRHHPGIDRHHGIQGEKYRGRGLRLPRPARRRPGRAPAPGGHHRLQSQPEHGRDQLPGHLHHPLLRRPRRDVQKAKAAGLSPCSGLIAGIGETDEELVDVVFALRELDPDSVPVDFLIPFEGPRGGEWNLTPQRCLRILAMVRFVCPDAEVRLAGGREIHLRSLQPLALHIVNSIFLGDYLTSEGQPGGRDLEMIANAGFTVEGADERTLPGHRRDLVRVRRRGPGTALPANA